MILTVAADIASLDRFLRWWEFGEYVSEAIVIMGCAGEFIAEFTDRFTGGDDGKKKRLSKLSLLALIGGLATGLMCLMGATVTSGQVIASLNERASNADERSKKLENSTQQLKTDAEVAHKETERAKESAAQAEAQVASATAEAAKANLELAKLKTPRVLQKEQQDRIRGKIGRFRGTAFDLYVNADSDSLGLMEVLDDTIRSAGWNFSMVAGGVSLGEKAGVTAISGVVIEIATDHRTEFESAAAALRDALITEGISTRAEVYDGGGKNHKAVHVMVGSKPLN